MAKKFVAFFVCFTLFGFLLAPPGHAMEGHLIVDSNLHDGIIAQWNEWSLQILDTSRYEFQKFSGIPLPNVLHIDEEQSNKTMLHISGSLWGYQNGEDVTFTITAFDKENSQDVFQDLTIHARHFSPEEIGALEIWPDCVVSDVAFFEGGNIQYNFDNFSGPNICTVFNSFYRGFPAGLTQTGSNRTYFTKPVNQKSARDGAPYRDTAWDDYARVTNALTIEATDQSYHYFTNEGEIEVPAGTQKVFDLEYSYENSRYTLAEGDSNWISLAPDAYEAIKNKKFTWNFPEAINHLNGEVVFGSLHTFEKRYVPKIELIDLDENGNFSEIEWSIVTQDDLSTPVIPNFDNNIENTNFEFRIYVFNKETNSEYAVGVETFPLNNGESANGSIKLDFSVQISDVTEFFTSIYQYDKTTEHHLNYLWNIYNRDFVNAPQITRDELPDAHIGDWYGESIWYNGVEATFSIIDGELPDGMNFDEWGFLHGTPEEMGSFTFTVRVENSNGHDERTFTLNVPEPTGLHLHMLSNAHAYFVNGKSDFSNIWPGDLNIMLFKDYNYEENSTSRNYSKNLKSMNFSRTANNSKNKKSELRQRIEFLKKINSRKLHKKNQSSVKNVKSSVQRDKSGGFIYPTRINNAFTLAGGEAYSYHVFDWEGNGNHDVSKNQAMTFELRDNGNHYAPTVFRSDDYYNEVAFSRSTGTPFKNRTISWNLSQGNLSKLNGNGKNSKILSLNDETKSEIPYIELNEENGLVDSINVRFVKKSSPKNAVTLKYDFRADVFFDYVQEEDDENNNEYWPENNLEIPAGEKVQGTIKLNNPIAADRIKCVLVYFNRGNEFDDYQWLFENPKPRITTEFDGQNLSEAYLDQPYDWGIWTNGGVFNSSTKWSISNGKLPGGISLYTNEDGYAYFDGTPTEIGSFTFTLKVENQYGSSTAEFTIRVLAPSKLDFIVTSIVDSYFKNGKSAYDEKYNFTADLSLGKNYDENYNDSAKPLDRASKKSGVKLTQSEIKKQNDYFRKLHTLRQLQKTIKNSKISGKSLEKAKSILDKTKALLTSSNSSRRLSNAFTIGSGNEYYYWDWRADGGKVKVEEGEAKTFDLFDDGWNYHPVFFLDDDDDYNHIWINLFNGEDFDSLDDTLNGRKITWDFSNSDYSAFSGGTTIDNFSQLDYDDIVPYIEFEPDNNGNINTIKVRLVQSSNPSEPITVDFYTDLNVNYALYNYDDAENLWIENNTHLEPGYVAEGEAHFNRDVPLSNIWNLNVSYNHDGRNYNWCFNNPLPRIRSESEGQHFYTPYVNEYYDCGIWIDGGLINSSDVNWSISGGKLPDGLEIVVHDDGFASISGIPTETGHFTFTIRFENSYGSTEETFTINVTPRPDPSRLDLFVNHRLYLYFKDGKMNYDKIWFNDLTFQLRKNYDDLDRSNRLLSMAKSAAARNSEVVIDTEGKDSVIRNIKPATGSKLAKATAKIKNKKLTVKPSVPIKTTAKNKSTANSRDRASSLNRIDNAFTFGKGAAYWYRTDYNDRTEVANNKAVTFSLREEDPFTYMPAVFNDKGDSEYSNIRFRGNISDLSNNRTISWKKIGKTPAGSAKLNDFFEIDGILSMPVPYFELGEEDEEGVKTINWRFVNENDTDTPVTLDFTVWGYLWLDYKRYENSEQYNGDNGFYVEAENPLEGTITLAKPIPREDIGMIIFHCEREGSEIGFEWRVATAAPVIYTEELPEAHIGEDYCALLGIDGDDIFEGFADYQALPFSVDVVWLEDENTLGVVCSPTQIGDFPITITARNDYGEDTRDYTIHVSEAPFVKPVINKVDDITTEVGDDFYYKFGLQTYTPVSWDITGLPKGVNLSDWGLALDRENGTLSGNPEKVWKGKLTVTAKNPKGTAKQQFNLTISGDAPDIDLGDLPENETLTLITDKINYDFEVKVTGDFGTTFNCKGKLPKDMEITPVKENGEVRAFKLSGTPTKKGTATLNFTASNALTKPITKTVKFNFIETPVITTAEKLSDGTYGKNYSLTFKYKGGNSKTLSWEIISGDKPDGMNFDDKKGTLKGIPKTIGDHNFTVLLSDSSVPDEYSQYSSVSKDFTLHVKGVAPKIKTSKLNANYGVDDVNWKLETSAGSEPLSWDIVTENLGKGISADLPAGLTLNSDGTITGTPEQDFKGKVRFIVQNTEGSATKDISLTIKGTKPKFKKIGDQRISAGTNTTIELELEDGTPNLRFEWNSKTAPADWLTISETDGTITVTNPPYTPKPVTVKVKATNYTGSATLSFKIYVTNEQQTSSPLKEFDSENTNQEILDETLNEDTISEDAQIQSEDLTTEFNSEPEVLLTGGNAFDVGEVVSVNGIDYLVVASLPEMKVTESSQYDFELTLDENAQVGKDLFWFANPDNSEISEDDEIIEFADETGKEIKTVPENRIVIISAWFNKDVIYKPVIAVKLDN